MAFYLKNKKTYLLSSLSIPLLLTGCFDNPVLINSDDLPTNEMMPVVTVKADGENTYVNALLWHNKLAAVYETSQGEGFTATLASETKNLTEEETTRYYNGSNYSLTITSPSSSEKSYTTKFEGDFVDETVEVTLNRSGNHIDTTSSVVIPPASSITLPTDGQTLALDNNLDTTWSPSGLSEKVTLHFKTNCSSLDGYHWASGPQKPSYADLKFWLSKERKFTVEVPDTGSYNLAMTDILDISKYKPDLAGYVYIQSMDCSVKAYITRQSTGTLDEELKFGSIVAESTREMTGEFKVIDNEWQNYIE